MRILLILAVCLTSVSAYAQTDEEQYAALYGDGMRAYTESRYHEALTNLYRALAVKQTPLALKLIVRSHDFQGNCTARDRAVDMLEDLFPQASPPPPQRCATAGTLQIRCAPDRGEVRVDGQFDAPCNTTLRVPIGEHDLENKQISAALRVDVKREQTTVADLTMRPHKWYLDDRHKIVVELPDRWLRPGLLTDPDMPRTFKWKRPTPRK